MTNIVWGARCAAVAVLFLSGCTETSDTRAGQSVLEVEPRGPLPIWDRASVDLVDGGGAMPSERAPAAPVHASGGWIDVRSSPVTPWCAGVLVASDLVLTAASCVGQVPASRLEFGLGTPSGEGIAVIDVAPVADDRLVLLVLEEPVLAAQPAKILASPAEEGTTVEGIALAYVQRGETSARWTWTGVLTQEAQGASRVELPEGLRVEDFQFAEQSGVPNCHGDSGAGVFSEGGALVGVVVGGTSSEEAWPCVESLEVAGIDPAGLRDAVVALGGAPDD